MKRLTDKVFFVTGGGNGMGRSTVIKAAEEGAKVSFIEFNAKYLKETTDILDEMGAEYLAFECDATNDAAMKNAIEAVIAKFGPINVLVNNVGYDLRKLLHEVTDEEFDRTININMKSTYITTKYIAPGMIDMKDGVIINIASAAGLRPSPETPVYCAAKAGLIMLTKSMAQGYGPFNIRVNCICPGLTKTTMLASMPDEYLAGVEAQIPLRRIGYPEYIADAVIFLATKEANYISGRIISVDGALSL